LSNLRSPPAFDLKSTDVEFLVLWIISGKNYRGTLSLCADVHTKLRLILTKFEVPASVWRRWTDVQLLLLQMISGKSGRGNVCLCASYLGAQQVSTDSASVNFCHFFQKRLSPRWTDVQLLLLQMVSGKNGQGTCCLCAPYLRAQQVSTDSASVNFCQIFNSRSPTAFVGKTAKSEVDGCSIIVAADDIWQKWPGKCLFVCLIPTCTASFD